MIKIVYLILVHKAPSQLLRLIDALNDPETVFIIHVDKQVRASPFKIDVNKSTAKIHFINSRCEAHWGSFGLVQASLNGLRFIYKKYKSAQRVVLLSGEDYPIKPIAYTKAFFAHHKDTIFMNFFPIPYDKWPQRGLTRFLLYEEVSNGLDIYAGSQWLSFPVYVIDMIFKFLRINEGFLEYYKQCVLIPDESFFQTLFLNCGAPEITNSIVNQNLHLIKWDKPYMHPRTLTMKDRNIIERSKSLFARKFDSVMSAEVLAYIDKNICNLADNPGN